MADFLSEAIELGEGLGASGIGHPVEFLQSIAEDVLQIADQLNHAGASGGRKVFIDEQFAEGFANFCVNDAGGTLPARLLDFLVPEDLTVESERFVFGGGMKVRSCSPQNVPTEISNPIGEWTFVDEFVERVEK